MTPEEFYYFYTTAPMKPVSINFEKFMNANLCKEIMQPKAPYVVPVPERNFQAVLFKKSEVWLIRKLHRESLSGMNINAVDYIEEATGFDRHICQKVYNIIVTELTDSNYRLFVHKDGVFEIGVSTTTYKNYDITIAERDLINLMQSINKKVEAIKFIRQQYSTGLKEAKDLVDAVCEKAKPY